MKIDMNDIVYFIFKKCLRFLGATWFLFTLSFSAIANSPKILWRIKRKLETKIVVEHKYSVGKTRIRFSEIISLEYNTQYSLRIFAIRLPIKGLPKDFLAREDDDLMSTLVLLSKQTLKTWLSASSNTHLRQYNIEIESHGSLKEDRISYSQRSNTVLLRSISLGFFWLTLPSIPWELH